MGLLETGNESSGFPDLPGGEAGTGRLLVLGAELGLGWCQETQLPCPGLITFSAPAQICLPDFYRI